MARDNASNVPDRATRIKRANIAFIYASERGHVSSHIITLWGEALVTLHLPSGGREGTDARRGEGRGDITEATTVLDRANGSLRMGRATRDDHGGNREGML